jgi:hypothetical protein
MITMITMMYNMMYKEVIAIIVIKQITVQTTITYKKCQYISTNRRSHAVTTHAI